MVGVHVRDEMRIDGAERDAFLEQTDRRARPISNRSFSCPASTSVEALKQQMRGVGVPVPSSVTRISSARAVGLAIPPSRADSMVERSAQRIISSSLMAARFPRFSA